MAAGVKEGVHYRGADGAGQAEAAVAGMCADRFERTDPVDLVIPALAVGDDVTAGRHRDKIQFGAIRPGLPHPGMAFGFLGVDLPGQPHSRRLLPLVGPQPLSVPMNSGA